MNKRQKKKHEWKLHNHDEWQKENVDWLIKHYDESLEFWFDVSKYSVSEQEQNKIVRMINYHAIELGKLNQIKGD